MTARALGLAIAAVLASVGAASMAGGNTSGITTRQVPAPASPTPTAMRPKTPTSPAISVARAYVLAARTWSADTYERAWRRELELAAGAYRRALRAARPTDGQLADDARRRRGEPRRNPARGLDRDWLACARRR